MIIYPAIDISDGKCVRLLQGRLDDQTVYSDNPVDVALKWKSYGAYFLHVVDLDGAFTGTSKNLKIVEEIVHKTGLQVQLGGGIRNLDDIKNRIDEIGIFRVILGTAAFQNPRLIEKAVELYKEKIIIGIDALNGKVAIDGWTNQVDISPIDFALQYKKIGITTVIYTDIAKDGMLSGPNMRSTQELIQKTNMDIIASGGISTIAHVKELMCYGVSGVIIGKALYSEAIDLGDLLQLQED